MDNGREEFKRKLLAALGKKNIEEKEEKCENEKRRKKGIKSSKLNKSK